MPVKSFSRPNIYLEAIDKGQIDDLHWVIDIVRSKGINCPKILIFTTSVGKVGAIYRYLMIKLGCDAFGPDKRRLRKQQIIQMFHKYTEEETKSMILEEFTQDNSVIRVIVCTVAFGLGIDVSDIRYFILTGRLYNTLNFVVL